MRCLQVFYNTFEIITLYPDRNYMKNPQKLHVSTNQTGEKKVSKRIRPGGQKHLLYMMGRF